MSERRRKPDICQKLLNFRARRYKRRESSDQSLYRQPSRIFVPGVGSVEQEAQQVRIPTHLEQNYYRKNEPQGQCPSTTGRVTSIDIRVREIEGRNFFSWVATVICERGSRHDPTDFCNASWEGEVPIKNNG